MTLSLEAQLFNSSRFNSLLKAYKCAWDLENRESIEPEDIIDSICSYIECEIETLLEADHIDEYDRIDVKNMLP